MTEVNHGNMPEAIMVLLQEFKKVDTRLSVIEGQSKPTKNQHERLTRKEVSEQYKICLATIHNLMKGGKLAYEKLGKKTLFKRTDVEAYFQSKSKKISSNG